MTSWQLLLGVLGCALAYLLLTRLYRRLTFSSSRPPLVAARDPLLGSSLAFQRDPVGFLVRCRQTYGGAFTLDLAGTFVTILADAKAVDAYSRQRDDVLDSVAPLRVFGFPNTLGHFSAEYGAALISRCIKAHCLQPHWRTDITATLWAVMRHVLTPLQQRKGPKSVDLLPLARQILLRTNIAVFFGQAFYEALPTSFFAQFATWQDAQEEAAAKAIALPKWLLRHTVFRSVAQERLRLQRIFLQALAQATEGKVGNNNNDNAKQQGTSVGGGGGGGGVSDYLQQMRTVCRADADEYKCNADDLLAEQMIGFLFAAHKNPAIASANVLALLLSHPPCWNRARAEVQQAAPTPTAQEVPTPYVEQCIDEALRLTAHTIGSMRLTRQPFTFTTDAPDARTYTLPPDVLVGTSQVCVNYNDQVYPAPATFDPDRFSDQRKEHTHEAAAYLPFSDGRHRCPGRAVALLFVKSFVCFWLRETEEVQLKGGGQPQVDFTKATLAQYSARVTFRLRGA